MTPQPGNLARKSATHDNHRLQNQPTTDSKACGAGDTSPRPDYTRNNAPSRLPNAAEATAIVAINRTIPQTPSAAASCIPAAG